MSQLDLLADHALPLFVYGTLMTDERQAGLLAGCMRQRATVAGSLWRMPAGYPAVILGASGRVHGELCRTPDARQLRVLDLYEGVDEGLYRREIVAVTYGLRQARAWIYLLNEAANRTGTPIKSGMWRAQVRR